jgi:hypothetical protein
VKEQFWGKSVFKLKVVHTGNRGSLYISLWFALLLSDEQREWTVGIEENKNVMILTKSRKSLSAVLSCSLSNNEWNCPVIYVPFMKVACN